MRRVVITGIGLITPVGPDLEQTWSGLLAGKSGIGPITQFDTTGFATSIAGEVKGFDPSKYISKRDLRHFDRFLQFGITGGLMAMEDAGFEDFKVPEEEADDRRQHGRLLALLRRTCRPAPA